MFANAVAFSKKIQHTLIPAHKKEQQLKHTLAFKFTQTISHHIQYEKHESIMIKVMKEVGTRVCVLAMPFFVSVSVFQLGGLFIYHITSMMFSWKWDFDTLSKDLIQTASMVVDIFFQIIICPIGLIDPMLYLLEKPCVPVQSPPQQQQPIITGSSPPEKNEEVHALQQQQTSADPQIKTITGQRQQVDLTGDADPEITDVDDFICPNGTVELTIDCTNQTVYNIPEDLQIDRMVLISPENVNFFHDSNEWIAKSSLFSNIHTLVVRTCTDLSSTGFQKFVEKFNNIVCIDLRDCPPQNLTFTDRIVIRPNSLEETKAFINEKLSNLNEKASQICKNLIKGSPCQCKTRPCPCTQKWIKDIFAKTAGVEVFIPRITFLSKKKKITRGTVQLIIQEICEKCKMMEFLDLSETQISADLLKSCEAPSGRLKTLLLKNCPHEIIAAKRALPDSNKTLFSQIFSPNFNYGNRLFTPDPDYFIQNISDLFANGIETIRLDGIKGLHSIIENNKLRITENGGEIFYQSSDNKLISTRILD